MPDLWIDVDTALTEVPVNKAALIDSTDFITREEAVVYNQAGLDLLWNFVTTAGVFTQTAVTPTDTAGDYDWVNQGNGMYTIEIPASAGASINNDTEGFGWFSGFATGILPWISPVIGFRAAALNNALVDGGDTLDVNLTEISGDSIAADNLESQYDTTGLIGDTFPSSQSQLGAIANVSSAVNISASSYVLTTGTQSSGTVSNVEELDGTNHEHTDTAGAMDLYYEFLIGSGAPSSATVTGYLNSGNDNLEVHGYDWVSSSFKQIGTLAGKGATTNEVNSYELFVNMVGTGADLGKVRVRFTDGAFTLTTATLAIDQIFISFSLGTTGYENGSIWINTNASNTNTVPGIDGLATNPVSTWAAALTLSAATNITDFHIINGSSITLTANSDNFSIFGDNWALALGGQSCVDMYVQGATVSGIATAASGEMHFQGCDVSTASVQIGHFDFCGFDGTVTHTLAGDYNYHNCYSKVAGASAPVFAKTAGQVITAEFRYWSGGITINGLQSGDVVTVSGELGTVTLNGADATVEIRGTYKGLTNNLTGSPTVNTEGAINVDDILDEVNTGAAHNVTNSFGRQVRELRQTNVYDGGRIWIDTVNGAAGAVDYENGTVDNPVNNIADAATLSTSLGINRFEISPGSSFTLASTFTNYIFNGAGWTLALGGQDISGTTIYGASVTGVCTGANAPEFVECEIGAATFPPCHFRRTNIEGTVTVGSAGDFFFDNCHSAVAGVSAPVFDFGAAVGDTDVNFRHYSGGIQVENMGGTGTDTMSLEGYGQFIEGTCTGGTVAIRGNFTVSGITNLTLSDDARYDVTQILTQANIALSTLGIPKNAAYNNFEFFMRDTTDHVTGKTGLTVSVQRSIDGGAFGDSTNTPATEVANGIYKINLSAADTNGDVITFKFTGTDADATFITVHTI